MANSFTKQTKNYWFIPVVYIISALGLAILLDVIDRSPKIRDEHLIPEIFLTRSELAETVLSAIATSLLTMTTITFSVMMVVLSTYASQYSPRALPNFIRSRTMEHAQGIFFAGFTYSVTALLFLKRSSKEAMVPDAAVAVLLAVACLFFFVFFIHQVATFIQVNQLIKIISDRAVQLIQEIKGKGELTEANSRLKKTESEEPMYVYSPKEGYVQNVNIAKLAKLTADNDLYLRMIPRIGEYTAENEPLFEVWGCNEKDLLKGMERLVKIERVRNNEQDLAYVLEKIIETALRAISPGINDPNTAIYCIRELSICLKKLGYWNGRTWVLRNEQQRNFLEIPFYTFDEFVFKTYYQLRHYGASDVSVCHALLEALIRIAEGVEPLGKQSVLKLGEYVDHNIDKKVLHNIDNQLIQDTMEKLRVVCGKTANQTSAT